MTTFDSSCDFDRPASSQGLFVGEDEIRELERRAIDRIDGWQRLDGVDNTAVAVSFGLDSIPLANIAQKAGITESVIVWTPTGYPQHKQFARQTADKIGIELTEINIDWWTNEWVYNNREYLFPNAEEVDHLTNIRQLEFLERYTEERDINLLLYGRRRGDNPMNATQPLRDRTGLSPSPCYNGHPIREWKLDHILTYMEVYDFEPSPIYRMRNANSNGNGDGPWHDRDHIDRSGEIIEPLDSCWYNVYKLSPHDFYNDIIHWFPQGYSLAKQYAARNDLEFDHPEPDPAQCPPN